MCRRRQLETTNCERKAFFVRPIFFESSKKSFFQKRFFGKKKRSGRRDTLVKYQRDIEPSTLSDENKIKSILFACNAFFTRSK